MRREKMNQNGVRNTKAKNIRNGENCNFMRCKRKKTKNSSVQNCKGKESVVKSIDDADQAIGVYFQEEIIMDILSRLPVRSLLRFKCVSKFWKTLISDRNFKKKHLNHAKNNDKKFLVSQRLFGEEEKYNIYSSSLSLDHIMDEDAVQKLDLPLIPTPFDCKIWCCCDGLFLLALYDGRYDYFLLWNPSTRESMELPLPTFLIGPRCILGFGYDAPNDNYKILKVDLNRVVEIFTLKSGSWRTHECPAEGVPPAWPYGIGYMDYPPVVHGAFHWIIMLPGDCYVASFNISNEVYGEIPLLEGIFDTSNPMSCCDGISEMDGMLCFYSNHINSLAESTFKLFVMQEYGVKESWILLFTIQDANLFAAAPRYRFADGEVLLNCVYWGHVGSEFRTSKKPFGLWPQGGAFLEGFAYTESLISPNLLT